MTSQFPLSSLLGLGSCHCTLPLGLETDASWWPPAAAFLKASDSLGRFPAAEISLQDPWRQRYILGQKYQTTSQNGKWQVIRTQPLPRFPWRPNSSCSCLTLLYRWLVYNERIHLFVKSTNIHVHTILELNYNNFLLIHYNYNKQIIFFIGLHHILVSKLIYCKWFHYLLNSSMGII